MRDVIRGFFRFPIEEQMDEGIAVKRMGFPIFVDAKLGDDESGAGDFLDFGHSAGRRAWSAQRKRGARFFA